MEYYSDERDWEYEKMKEAEEKAYEWAARDFEKAIDEAFKTLSKQPGFLEILFKCSENPGEIVFGMQRRAAKTFTKFVDKFDIIAAKYADEDERERMASSKGTSPTILAILAEDEDWYVMRAVARNPKTPQKLIEMLAHDEDNLVRIAAEKHIQ